MIMMTQCMNYCRFIVPTAPIHWGATMVHGMKVKDGRLVRRGQDLDADDDAAAVLGDFFRWLLRQLVKYVWSKPTSRWCLSIQKQKNVILVAHNGARFDFPLLFSMARRLHLRLSSKLQNLRLADSLPACKPFKEEFGNCKLNTLKRCLAKVHFQRIQSIVGSSPIFREEDLRPMMPLMTAEILERWNCFHLFRRNLGFQVLAALARKSGLTVEDLLLDSGEI